MGKISSQVVTGFAGEDQGKGLKTQGELLGSLAFLDLPSHDLPPDALEFSQICSRQALM